MCRSSLGGAAYVEQFGDCGEMAGEVALGPFRYTFSALPWD